MHYKIRTKNLNFFYGKYHALKDINVSIAAGEVTALIGHSGGGKSTLLRTFNRIYSLYPKLNAHGEIFLDNTNILSPKEDLMLLRKRVGMVFQRPTPFPMSIYDNIAFGIKLYERLKAKEIDERVEWALRKAAIWDEVKDKLKQSSHNLSHGQQQRLCIARTISVKPEVLLLDEPTSALDPKSSKLIEKLVLELKHDYTIVIVTHNLKQAKNVSDYTAHMHHGELVGFGKTKELFSNPQSEITRDYIEEN